MAEDLLARALRPRSCPVAAQLAACGRARAHTQVYCTDLEMFVLLLREVRELDARYPPTPAAPPAAGAAAAHAAMVVEDEGEGEGEGESEDERAAGVWAVKEVKELRLRLKPEFERAITRDARTLQWSQEIKARALKSGGCHNVLK